MLGNVVPQNMFSLCILGARSSPRYGALEGSPQDLLQQPGSSQLESLGVHPLGEFGKHPVNLLTLGF